MLEYLFKRKNQKFSETDHILCDVLVKSWPPRRSRTSVHGHVTGSFAAAPRKIPGGGIHNSLSRSIDFAKLNPNCHMNYSNYL